MNTLITVEFEPLLTRWYTAKNAVMYYSSEVIVIVSFLFMTMSTWWLCFFNQIIVNDQALLVDFGDHNEDSFWVKRKNSWRDLIQVKEIHWK